MNRDGSGVVLDFRRKSVRQARESPHAHSHRQICALNVARPDMVGIRVTINRITLTIDADRWAVTQSMEYLEEHGTINNKQARNTAFIHEDWRVKSIFRGMEEKKMIKQVEGTRTSATKYKKWTSANDLKVQPNLFGPSST